MSDLFGTGATSNKVEQEQDFGKRTLNTDVYEAEIKMAFAGQSAKGARSVTLQLKLANGKDYNETIYVSNQAGKNTYEKDGKEYYLPGFLLINAIAIMTCEKSLHDLAADVETKTIKLYDFDSKKEVLTDVPAIVPMIGKKIKVAITEEEYEKNTKVGNDYVPSGEVGLKNTIVKIYDFETNRTSVEIRDNKEATQMNDWLKTYRNKVKIVEVKGTKGTGTAASATTPSGLFGS